MASNRHPVQLAPGLYRIEVGLTGDGTTVTVRSGSANMTTGASTVEIEAGKSAVVTGFDVPRYDLHAAVRSDEWEDWCQWREFSIFYDARTLIVICAKPWGRS